MKKLLFTSVIMLGGLLALSQQSLSVFGLVQDSSFNSIPGQPVWINLYSNGNFISQQKLISSTSGYYNYFVPAQPNATLEVMTNDCNGRFYSNTYVATATDSAFDDTLRIGCVRLSQGSCSGSLTQWSNGNQVRFKDNGVTNTLTNAVIERHWVFGDGSFQSTYDVDSVDHLYSSSGQYSACVIRVIADTTRNIIYCEDTTCLSFNISGGTTNFCSALFDLDSAQSGGSSLVVYNLSTPAHNNANYVTSYDWDFGDGGTSAQAFPVYSYAQPGAYNVCLTITSLDAAQNVCTDTYCDTLGIDSLGNVIHKSGQGFTLTVLNPVSAIGIEETRQTGFVKAYPNPASSVVKLELQAVSNKKTDWKLLNTRGESVLEGVLQKNTKDFRINVEPLTNGLYHLLVLSGRGVSTLKLMVY